MVTQDARTLSAAAQESLRRRVVEAVNKGMTPTEAAKVFAVSRQAVYGWVQRFRDGGVSALKSARRGRPARSCLQPHQAASTVRSIVDRCPDQLRLPFALWTREAVRQLISKRFGIHISVWTAGRYLRHWGLTPQKPIRRAYEQDPAAVRRWLKHTYPTIRRQAKEEKAEIHWSDEMGLRSDHQAGRSYGMKGCTPVILGTGQRFGCNMISSITNRGRLCFMVFKKRFTSRVFIAFLDRLIRQVKRKIFLVVDRHPAHLAKLVTRWLASRQHRIRLLFLPTYSPDLNPDEMLNQDVKSNAVGRRRPTNQGEMMADVRGYLRSTQKQPAVVRTYFQAETVRYAA